MEDIMPTTPRARRPVQSKTKAAEQAFTSRVSQMLEPEGRENGSAGPHGERAMHEGMAAAAQGKPTERRPKFSVERPNAEALSAFMGEGFARLTDAFGALQDSFRDATTSLTDSRVTTTRNVTALQQKVLEITQQNVSEMINHAQRMMRVGDMSEAFKLQANYAQGALKTFATQADELRALSVKLARDASEPISERINRSMERFRTARDRS
jgi:phasin family protein